ncbi:MAG: hypothetical protein WAM13_18770 [Candidatus Sulfotelmatobacter sp.]
MPTSTGMTLFFGGNYLTRFELRGGGCAVEKLVELLAMSKMAAGKDLSPAFRRLIFSS